MKLSLTTSIAIHAMAHLAAAREGGRIQVAEVAAAQGASRAYTAKVFQLLSRAGLVSSHQGVGGGFTLGREPERITILDIIEAAEGPLTLSLCPIYRADCRWRPICGLHRLIHETESKLAEAFSQATLAEMAHRGFLVDAAEAASRKAASQSVSTDASEPAGTA